MTVRPSPNDHQGANGRAERAVFFFADWLHAGSPGEWRIRRLWPARVYRPRADQSRISSA
jgi:hypothetical protein